MFPFAYASNTLTALSPEWWVAEGLRVLEKELIVLPVISTDYNDMVARSGQVIHVHKKNKLEAQRKLAGSNVTASALEADDLLIRLDQQPYVHYKVDDIEQTVSMGDVVNDWIEPGFQAIARWLDEACALQGYSFFRNQAGSCNGASYDDLVDLSRVLNVLEIPKPGRICLLNSNTESDLLKEDKLTRADAIGDGSRLLNGIIGSGAGFGLGASLSLPMDIDDVNKIKVAGVVNNSAGYPKGATTLVVDGITGLLTVGSFIKLQSSADSGLFSVHQITAQTASGGNTIGITIVPGLIRPVANDATFNVYTPGTLAASYSERHMGAVRITPASGTIPDAYGAISFAADGPVYGILKVTDAGGGNYDLILNRPLDAAVTSGGLAALFPPVNMSWTMMRDAVTMVNRPLRLPKGAVSAANGSILNVGVRVVIGYNQESQEELVTIDTLFGVQNLDLNKGAVLFS